MIELIKYASTSLLWGILIGLFCLVIFFIIVKGWWKDTHFNLKSYLISSVLGVVLIYQCTLLCGAMIIINMANDCEPAITSYVNQYTSETEYVLSEEETNSIISNLVTNNPLVANHIDTSKLQDCAAKELPGAIISQVKNNRRWFIFRRILWSLGFSFIAAVFVIKSISHQQDKRRERIYKDRERVKRNNRTRINRYRH